MRTVVVLPTYNEALNVVSVLAALMSSPARPDVLVVDDSSPDGTADIVRRLAADEPRIQVHVRPERAGLGAAYVDGFRRVLDANRYDAVVQMDCDGSHDPSDVARLVEALADADLAIGSRYVPGGDIPGWSFGRRLLSRAGNVYARLWLGLEVRDATGGFKAWRATTLAAVDLPAVRSNGYGFQIETTTRAVAAGARVVEVPIVFRDRQLGTSKMDRRIALEALRVVPALRPLARAGVSPARPGAPTR